MKPSSLLLTFAVVAAPLSAFAAGDPVAGAKTFKVCSACHIATEAKNKVGPTLQGVVGRPVASIADFKYSKAMTDFGQGKVWDEAQLTEYLKSPRTVVKGTKMAFAGLKKDDEIANVIAYLKDPAAGGQ